MRNLLIRLNINNHGNIIDGMDIGAASAWVGQNYPNPFKGSTLIDFELINPSEVILSVMDLSGRKVMEVSQGQMPVGKHTVTLQTTGLEAGAYFYTLRAGGFTQTRQMVIVN
jgi:hypothetical protein